MSYYDKENLSPGSEALPQTRLVNWIEEQLRLRDWRPADLARAAGVRDSTISRILNGNAKAGPELCSAMAEALDVSPVEVFRIAELLPASAGMVSELTQNEAEMITLYRQLSPENRAYALHFLRGFVDQVEG